MDMPNAMPEEVKDQIEELIGCDRDDIIEASGKTGLGVDKILEAVGNGFPHPRVIPTLLFRLWCSTQFNSFRGIITYCRIMNGSLKKGDIVKFVSTGKEIRCR